MYRSITLFFSLLTLFITTASAQQTTTNKAAISLTGRAELKINPDLVQFSITVYGADKTLSNAMLNLNEKVAALLKKIDELKINKDDCKVQGFHVDQEYDYSTTRPRKVGYKAVQTIRVQISSAPEKINQLVSAFSSENFPDITTYFNAMVSDKLRAETENKLIALAIADAEQHAELIAKRTAQKIIRPLSIDYHVQQAPIMPMHNMNRMAVEMKDASSNEGFAQLSLEEITLSETILIVYETEMAKP